MQIIGFIGYVNKFDFIINVAKTLSICGKKVLMVDGTVEQKLRYSMPTIEKTDLSYITEYDEIQAAVNFTGLSGLEKYMLERNLDIEAYDYILMDIDNIQAYDGFRKRDFAKVFFFMDHTKLSIEKNLEILNAIFTYKKADQEVKMSKVLFKMYIDRPGEEYYESKLKEFNVAWDQDYYEIPYDESDRVASATNDYLGEISLKKFSALYKKAIVEISASIIGELQTAFVKKELKMYDRRKK